MEGSLDSPEIRQLLLTGMNQETSKEVRERSVNLIANECKVGHACAAEKDGKGIRGALLVSLRYDRDMGVRMKALAGLQQFIGQDQRVRDAVLEALLHDKSAEVRTAAIDLLTPGAVGCERAAGAPHGVYGRREPLYPHGVLPRTARGS